ncbi:hypothetical protein RB597_003906 [Gaeumannomyces tritici]
MPSTLFLRPLTRSAWSSSRGVFMPAAAALPPKSTSIRRFGQTAGRSKAAGEDDPRLEETLGREIADDYATLRTNYASPKLPVVLAHGLLGFATLELAQLFPPIEYWHGIRAALEARGVTVITPSVPASASIQVRAARLAEQIAAAVPAGTPVNIVAHSMGGLDARLMASPAFEPELLSRSATAGRRLNVASLVTVSTPHHGSSYADHVIAALGPRHFERARGLLASATGWSDTGAFEQLTPRHMDAVFNPATPDHPDTAYFSYGAMTDGPPPLMSPFRVCHRVIEEREGPNDGLVSVRSARWGSYRGTIKGVTHLGLINWTNRLGWSVRKMLGQKETFNALAFYLDIADMLAKEGY